MDVLFKGVATAMITPFNENGINYPEYDKLIDRQIDAGIEALVIIGTTGEPSTMSEDERREIIKHAVTYANGRCKIIAGTGANDTKKAVELSIYAESVGADAVLCVTPYYNKCTKNGIVKYFQTICGAIKIPVFAYNVPPRTGVNITPEVVRELIKIPNLCGLKEASNDFVQIAETAFVMDGKKPLYCGDDETILPFLSLGAMGTISVLSNVAPKETKAMHDMFFSGDIQGAYRMYRKLYPLANALFIEVNPIPCKSAMALLGFDTRLVREPLTPMEQAHEDKLKRVMQEFGILK
ncbi:MAG: 4-hydroxy-tetrahydrodipicolinate synthase [Clostridia bacterium]